MSYSVDSHGDVVCADGGDSPRHPTGDVPIVHPDPILVKVVLEDLRGAVPVEQFDAGLAAEDEDRATVEGTPLGRRDDDDAGGLGPVVHVHLARLRHCIGTDGRKDVAAHRAQVYLIPVGVKADDLLRGMIEVWGRAMCGRTPKIPKIPSPCISTVQILLERPFNFYPGIFNKFLS